MIDTHTHLYADEFQEDLDQVVQSAMELGVSQFFLPAIDSHTTEAMLDLERKYPKMHAMMGLHPCYVKPETYEEEMAQVKKWLDKRAFIAVGEIGIDLHWDKSTLDLQQQAFKQQIQWAKEKYLPIVIHVRNSFDETFEVLEEEKGENLSGVLHCFTGDLVQAKQAIAYNLKLGIGGVVTFKNGKIDQFLNQISLSNLVLETDSPYLAPVPHRGKRNESAYVQLVAQKLSNIYQLPLEEINRITTKNALEVFKMP